MRFTDLLKILLILTLFSVFTACSEDDDGSPTEPDNGGDSPPSLNVKQVQVPQSMQTAANNGDPGAAQATAYIQLANTLPSYAQLFNPPQAAKLSSTSAAAGEWTWTQDGATFTLVSTETGTEYEMTLSVDGTFGGTTYNNQVLMEASGLKDGSSGELYFYDPDSSTPVLSFSWETLADGTYHLVMNQSSGAMVELYSYTDGSGSLDVDVSGGGSWDIDWASNGSGTWVHYDAQGGIVDQGSWN